MRDPYNHRDSYGPQYVGETQRRGFRIPPRLLMALGLALFAVISYYVKTKKVLNPYTNKNQRIAILSEEQEVALGLQSAPEMIRESGGLVRDPAVTELVTRLGNQLVEASTADENQTHYQFQFHVLADMNTVNAFALPGGQVFITMGLVSKLEYVDEIAGVLGHEIGHVLGRHSNAQMAKGQLFSQLGGAISVAADGGASGSGLGQLAAHVMSTKFGRDDELESDIIGVNLLIGAGYDPDAMIGVLTVLSKLSQGGGPEIMSTHPHPEKRLRLVQDYIQKLRATGKVPAPREPRQKLWSAQ